MLNTSELAFFHNNWIADAKIEAVSYAARFNNLGIGVNGKWLYLPFTQYGYFGDRLSKGYYSEAAAALNCSYNFFPGYYFGGVSFGVNVKGALRSVPDYDSGEKGEVTPGSGRAQSAAALMADAGFLTRVNLFKFYNSRERNMSFALVARNLGPPALGEALPSVIIAGISYRPLRPLLMSFDFSVPVNMADVRRSESPYWAAGLSVTATDFLSMRAGLLMKAGNIRATLGSEVGLQHLSLDINYTLDLLTQIQPLNRVALGVRFNLGDNGAKAKSDLVDEYYLAGLNAYSDARDEEARALFEKALALNPRFEPAIEALKSLDEYQKLNERITGIQTIEY
jgi:tetratricopeptide (TPR) repeat protein